jgi:hypothetical protein
MRNLIYIFMLLLLAACNTSKPTVPVERSYEMELKLVRE